MNKLSFHILEPLRFPLINRIYKQFYPAGKAKKDEVIWVGEDEKQIISCVRFKTIEDTHLLTGMLVIPEYRGIGISEQLLSATLTHIETKPCYCFAFSHLVPLYQKAQFEVIETHELPHFLASRIARYSASGKDLVPMRYQKPALSQNNC
ncbi:acyltransferase [Photobacterium jeanii]|uniref:Acyltransferase n=1 Tax=Photobacterium jeanii TaxID=858640 RepID=A0A178KGF9_9GAMM|nr:GNAT family N-acetyltransferase [Photobacterium jeanii]OAN16358.1 acyltransferase [Photobacterium jeanii]PST87382.1 N-acetyltransferase [Photobacterium jeanii]